MTPGDMENAAAGYTGLWLLTSFGAIGFVAGFVDNIDHPGLLVAGAGLVLMSLVASHRRARLLRDAERARAVKEAGL